METKSSDMDPLAQARPQGVQLLVGLPPLVADVGNRQAHEGGVQHPRLERRQNGAPLVR